MYSSFQAACLRRARMLTLGVRSRPVRLMAILRRIARLRAAVRSVFDFSTVYRTLSRHTDQSA